MGGRKLVLFVDRSQNGFLNILGIKFVHLGFRVVIHIDRGFQSSEYSPVVDDQTEILAFINPVHTRDRLEKIVFPQGLVNVQNAGDGRVESRQELVLDDKHIDVALGILEITADGVVIFLVVVAEERLDALAVVILDLLDGGRGIVVVVPLPFVSESDHDAGIDLATGQGQKDVIHFHRGCSRRADHHRFQSLGQAIVDKVIVDIEGDQIDAAAGFRDLGEAAELFFQFSSDVLVQILRQTLEIGVDGVRRIILLDLSSLVHQRDGDLVFDRAFHGIVVDGRPELLIGVLLFGRDQGSSGKGDQRRVGQHLAHIVVHRAVLRTVRLVDQNVEAVAVGLEIAVPADRFKLVDQRSDHTVAFIFQDRFQPFSGLCSDGLHLRIRKVVPDLLVQTDAVGNNHKTGVLFCFFKLDLTDQHHHRKTFAAALRVPDDASRRSAVVQPVDAVHRV